MDRKSEFRVLLVALEATELRVLCPGLRAAGFEVACAPDVGQVMPRVSQWRPAVVVVDLTTADGPAVASQVRAQSAWRRPFLLGLADGHDTAVHQRAEQAGIDLLIFQPLQVKRVVSLLDRFAAVLADTASFDPVI